MIMIIISNNYTNRREEGTNDLTARIRTYGRSVGSMLEYMLCVCVCVCV